MRKVSFEEYDKKRKSSRIDLLVLRDQLDRENKVEGLRNREHSKRFLLFKIAREKKLTCFKK